MTERQFKIQKTFRLFILGVVSFFIGISISLLFRLKFSLRVIK